MLQRGGRLLLSPSDLNTFLACEHRTAPDLARARGVIVLERVPRPDAELVAERGREHERAHLLGTEDTRSFRPRDFEAYAARVQARFFRTLQA